MHAAAFYHGQGEYLDAVVPFIFAGLDNDEVGLVSAPGHNLTMLRDALGDAAAAVTFVDAAVVGRNPARLLGMQAAFLAKHPGRSVRMVGEVMWPGRTDDEYPGVVNHEALFNTAFADSGITGLCPYDASTWPQDVLTDARATHPLLWQHGALAANTDYAPDAAAARYNEPLPSDGAALTYLVAELADLSPARSFATRYAQQAGLAPDRVADLQLIATELATNSLQHGGGACELALWQRNGHIVCQASDSGRLDDPLAGRRLPPAGAIGGRGLFLVNTIADLVRMHATPTGTTIQAYLRLTDQR